MMLLTLRAHESPNCALCYQKIKASPVSARPLRSAERAKLNGQEKRGWAQVLSSAALGFPACGGPKARGSSLNSRRGGPYGLCECKPRGMEEFPGSSGRILDVHRGTGVRRDVEALWPHRDGHIPRFLAPPGGYTQRPKTAARTPKKRPDPHFGSPGPAALVAAYPLVPFPKRH
jgi:hypothetical protein